MKATKCKKLEAKGWKIDSTDEFLNLSPEEAAYIELKLSLSNSLKQRRLKEKLSQVELAKMVESSQSRVAKMEAGDPSVSIDLLVKSLLVISSISLALSRTLPR